MTEKEIEKRLFDLTNGLGPFAPSPEKDQARIGEQMISEINELEKAIRGKNVPGIEYQIAIAVRNYTAWFIRGDERKPYLERAVAHLQKAAETGSSEAKIELSRILIEEKLVRDLDIALQLAEELKQRNQLPDWMIPSVEKAKRWAGKIEIPHDSDFSTLSATPAAIREERTKLRKLLTTLVKSGDMTRARNVAKRLYNLGLLAAYLYGDFDGSSGVTGAAFSTAEGKLEEVNRSFNFEYLGRITDANFLTTTDYNRIEKILGQTTKTTSIRDIETMV